MIMIHHMYMNSPDYIVHAIHDLLLFIVKLACKLCGILGS